MVADAIGRALSLIGPLASGAERADEHRVRGAAEALRRCAPLLAAARTEIERLAAQLEDGPPDGIPITAGRAMRALLATRLDERPDAVQVHSSRGPHHGSRRTPAGPGRRTKTPLAPPAEPEPPLHERPIAALAGVGPAIEARLVARGIRRVGDLLGWLPRRYEDGRAIVPLTRVAVGVRQATVGIVRWARSAPGGRAEAWLDPPEGCPPGPVDGLRLVWFHAPWGPPRALAPGRRVRVMGTPEWFRGVVSMPHPDWAPLDDTTAAQPIVPRYPEIAGVAPRQLERLIRLAVDRALDGVPEAVPRTWREREGLPGLHDALRTLHRPPSDLDAATLEAFQTQRSAYHARLAFEEFFVLELALHERRVEEQRVGARPLRPLTRAVEHAIASLPFALTRAQQRVVAEITADLERERPMRRLLQGDVGAGKTAVAMLAAAHAVSAQAQVAFMAPTEVLAEQHLRALQPLSAALGLRVALLLGGARASHRRAVLRQLADGRLDVVVGTHALLSDAVRIPRLGLVIVDEQHRFGVAQRLRLVRKGDETGHVPHLLVMTATPIPRSLALALYGDLSASVLDEMPPGRLPPTTRAYPRAERERALRQLERGLQAGGSAYVVCPAIGDGIADDGGEELGVETDGGPTVASTFEELRARLAPRGIGVARLHGRLPAEERARVMDDFAAARVRVLVATTLVEVGLDVPHANVMLVEGAERFGLAQLHQLRGRVGRAGQPSACLLVHDANGGEALDRIRVLCETTDGFRIAEEDLRLRGPGELFGRRQSGLPGFRFGDLRRDLPLLERARELAAAVLADDPRLERAEHAGARAALEALRRDRGGAVREEAG
ncbi:MAG: ATP-dependent DNA helicase RecG [Myxococcota bacterium]|nr:ATP-dependent DNA helicase RecG [Myxococcota bacterium]